MGIVHTLHFFLQSLPEAARARRYLAAMNALCRGDGTDYYTWQMATSAGGSISSSLLKQESLRRMSSPKEPERCQGVLMAISLANCPEVLAKYRYILSHGTNRNEKVAILAISGSLPRRDMALLSLDRLVNDSLADVRDWAARCLKSATQAKAGLGLNDLTLLLFPLLETQDSQVRVTLGHVAAGLTTDLSLLVDEKKLSDDVLLGFVSEAKPLRLNPQKDTDRRRMVRLWRNWWNTRRDGYTKPVPPPIVCW
jgi:hypothetical protein